MPTLTCQRDKFFICTIEVLTNSVKQLNGTLKFRILGVEHHVQVNKFYPVLDKLAELAGAKLAQMNSLPEKNNYTHSRVHLRKYIILLDFQTSATLEVKVFVNLCCILFWD